MTKRFRTSPLSLRNYIIATIVGVSIALLTGCTTPLSPSSFTCKTQARIYVLVDGTVQSEVDTYVQSTPCPATPIR